ncbi:MAG: hypothetical protein JSS87_03610 [Acidobacteria bacterium]|nr:hypothetical protein [Acidobacteriota bacterium]
MQTFATLLLVSSLVLSAAAEPPSETAPAKTISKRDRDDAEKSFLRGAKLYRESDFDAAEDAFLQAVKLDPEKHAYIVALTMSQDHRISKLVQKAAEEREHHRVAEADALIAQARAIDPSNPLVQQHEQAAALLPVNVERFAGSIRLTPTAQRRSFHLKSQTRGLLQQVASSFGIRTAFEQDVSSKNARIDLDDVDFETAMNIVCTMTDTMYVPLDDKTIMVAADTSANHDRLDRLEQETIFLPGLQNEEINDLGNVIRNVFEVRQATAQTKAGTLTLRATPDVLDAINRTLADMLDGGSEVMIRIQLFATDTQLTRGTGLTLPQQASLSSLAGLAQQIVSENQDIVKQLIASGTIPANSSTVNIALALIASGLVQNSAVNGAIAIVGGGLTAGLISAGNYPLLRASLLASDSKTLDDIQLRSGDRQTVNFRSGSRYPVIQSTYSSGINSALTSQLGNTTVNGVNIGDLLGNASSYTIPQITFEDLGLTVKATPRVGRNGDIALHLEMKIEALAGAALNNIPILSSRFLTSDVTVPAGDTAMIVSDLSEQESNAVDGTPGMADLPMLKYLNGHTTDKTKSNLVILLTPTLMRRGHLKLAGPYIPVQVRSSE